MTNQQRPKIEPVAADSEEMASIAPHLLAAYGAKGDAAMATMLRNRSLYEVWRPLARYLNGASILQRRDRELLVLRAAWLARSDYVWGNHVLVARDVGISDDEIAAICVGPTDGSWTPHDAALVRAADELVTTCTLSDQAWADVSSWYGDKEMVELIILVGHYVMFSYLLNSIRIQREHGVPGFDPSDWRRP
jgi:alkylhydroperoxidase family enzyme